MVRESQSSMIRYLLEGLLAFGALNAFGGGYYGLARPVNLDEIVRDVVQRDGGFVVL